VKKFDFICLTETFLDVCFDFSDVFVEYLKFYSPATKISQHGRNSGGVLVLVKKSFESSVKEIQLNCCNTVALLIDKHVFGLDKDVLFVSCYVAPEGSPVYNDRVLKDGIVGLEEAIWHYLDKDDVYFMLTGDFNARTGKEQAELETMQNYLEDVCDDGSEESRVSQDIGINGFGKSLLDFCFLFDMIILNGYCNGDKDGNCTFISPNGSSVIDYFLISYNLLCGFDLCVGDSLFSWHLPVEAVWKKGQPDKNRAPQQTGEERIVWSDENACMFKNELESAVFLGCLKNAADELRVNMNESVNTFAKALCGAAACMVRTVGKKKKIYNDWFDDECERKKHEVKRLLKRYQRCKSLPEKINKRNSYVSARKEYNKMRKNKEAAFTESRIKKLKESVSDSKTFWGIIRSVNRRGFVYNEITLEQWHDHFYNVFNCTDNDIVVDDEITEGNYIETTESLFYSEIRRDEVIAGIKHLKSGKTAGSDKIVGEMLKSANSHVIDYLVTLFNKLFDSGTFPSDWANSIIIPIFKKGDNNNPDNYRGIALTSVLSKVYTYILNKRLTEWSNKESKLLEEQAGFRSGYSTIDHIFTLYALVQKYLLRNTKLFVAFVDFRKAFDSVNRNALWNVLRQHGINSKLYKALKSVYNSVLASVRVDCKYSATFKCFQGVKQGCLLSPQLFSFFINELAMEIVKKGKHGIQLIPGALEIFLLLFADDVILLSGTANGLQNQINCLKLEADRLGLTVNLDKTNIIVFRKGGHLAAHESWYYGDFKVKVINTYKYLGLIFSTKLSLNYAWDESSRKGKKGVIEILKTLRRLKCSDFNLFWKLFDSQIEPLLTYAAEIWGLETNTKIEKVQNYAIKRFLNVPIHSSNTILYGETGRYPLFVKSMVKCIKYWLRLLKLPGSRICRQAYEMMLTQMELGKENWTFKVKKILCEQGFGIVWLSQGVGNEKQFISEFKERYICNYKQSWHAKLETNEKYSWFFSFKYAFEVEKYISVIEDSWLRTCMARFRLRTLGFNANKYWFHTDSSTEEPCPMCSCELEDEDHFLFHCKAYENLRVKYVFFESKPTRSCNVTEVLRSQNDNTVKSIAMFIAEALKLRQNVLHGK
jgi:hypothetical protein